MYRNCYNTHTTDIRSHLTYKYTTPRVYCVVRRCTPWSASALTINRVARWWGIDQAWTFLEQVGMVQIMQWIAMAIFRGCFMHSNPKHACHLRTRLHRHFFYAAWLGHQLVCKKLFGFQNMGETRPPTLFGTAFSQSCDVGYCLEIWLALPTL